MDFHEDQDDHEMEEEEEEMGIPETYDPLQSNSILNQRQQPPPTTATATPPPPQPPPQKPRYRECLKNHAVGIGGHAVDGCGEFIPTGPENTLDALKCAACNCHRSFHRKEPTTTTSHLVTRPRNDHELFFHSPVHNFSPCYRPPTGYLHVAPQQARPPALPSTSGGGGGREDNYQEDISGSSKKRFRTKFTQEQKDKMLTLAENLGWRIQKHDEDAVQQFCNETGVQRNVFKVWMHNNKHTLGKKP